MLNTIAAKLGFVRLEDIRQQLNFGYSVAKRLDEHREVVERVADVLVRRPDHRRQHVDGARRRGNGAGEISFSHTGEVPG